MIGYKPDMVTLFYIDENGTEISSSPMDGMRYSDMLTIKSAQDTAASYNSVAVDKYVRELAIYQASVDNGRLPASGPPAKPYKLVVSDQGVNSVVAFSPALPEPKPLVVAPHLDNSGKSAPAADRTDVLINLMVAANAKLDRLLAK